MRDNTIFVVKHELKRFEYDFKVGEIVQVTALSYNNMKKEVTIANITLGTPTAFTKMPIDMFFEMVL